MTLAWLVFGYKFLWTFLTYPWSLSPHRNTPPPPPPPPPPSEGKSSSLFRLGAPFFLLICDSGAVALAVAAYLAEGGTYLPAGLGSSTLGAGSGSGNRDIKSWDDVGYMNSRSFAVGMNCLLTLSQIRDVRFAMRSRFVDRQTNHTCTFTPCPAWRNCDIG